MPGEGNGGWGVLVIVLGKQLLNGDNLAILQDLMIIEIDL